MNFQLKDLHLHFEQALLDEAEAMVSSGDLQKISETQKNVWQLKFDYENVSTRCELSATGKVRKYTCSCVVFSLYKKCKHAAAICLLIQKIKLNASGQEVNSSTTARSIPLGKILKHTSHVELTGFLLEFAKTSPELTSLLKARFLFNYPEEYTVANDPILSVQTERLINAKRPAESNLFDIYKSVEAYFTQAERKLGQHETMAAFNILSIIGNNLNKLIRLYRHDNEKLNAMSVRLFGKYLELYRIFVAPEAKSQLAEQLLEARTLIAVVSDNSWHEKYIETLLLTLSNDVDFQDVKNDLFNNHFQQIKLIENRSAWLMFDIQSDLLRNEKPDPGKTVRIIGQDIDLLRSLLARLIQKLHYELVEQIIKEAIKYDEDYFAAFSEELNSILLEMAVRLHNFNKAEKLLLANFPANPDSRILAYVKQQFPVQFDELMAKLDAIQLAEPEQQLALEIALGEIKNDFSVPVDTIVRSNDIRLLVKYDYLFWPNNAEDTLELYKTMSKTYLETHFGEPARIFINEMFEHLENNRHKEQAKLIRKFLNPLFSKRIATDTKMKYPVI